MANTYTKLYIHIVMAVWGRYWLINQKHEEEIYSYMAGILKGRGHSPLIINGMPDHVHLLVGLNPSEAISDMMRELKKSSTGFINKHRLTRGKFNWQEGYGAFSYSRSQINSVHNYITRQKEHHKKVIFRDEYLELLKSFDVVYNERYIFDF